MNMIRMIEQEMGTGTMNEKHLLDTDETLKLLTARVTTLVQALRLTVEYVGTDLLHPGPGWDWFEALKDEPWFDKWLRELTFHPYPVPVVDMNTSEESDSLCGNVHTVETFEAVEGFQV